MKSNPTKKKSPTSKQDSTEPKKKSLFDHVKHIRQEKDPNYYVNLSDDDKKSFLLRNLD